MVRLILLRMLESYFRRPFLNLVPLILLLGFGAAYVSTRDPIYMSGGKLSINDDTVLSGLSDVGAGGFIWVTAAEATVDQFGELIATDSFVRAIVMQTDLEQELNDPETDVDEFLQEVRDNVWAATIGDKTVGIASQYDDPVVVQQLSIAAIDSFLQWNINTGLSDSLAAQEFYSVETAAYQIERDSAIDQRNSYLAANPEPVRGERPEIQKVEIERLSEIVNQASARFTAARDKEETARLAAAQAERQVEQKFQLLDAPQLPDEPSSGLKDDVIMIAIFGIIGGILCVVGVVGGALLDRTFRYPIDVRQGLELPVLGAIPAGEIFSSPHTLSIERALAIAPEPPRYRARLVPNADPPTLIILPDERAELEQILHERSQHEQFAPSRQERNVPNGFPTYDLGPDPLADGVPTQIPGARGRGQAASGRVDMADRERVRDFWNGHSSNQGNRPYTGKKK